MKKVTITTFSMFIVFYLIGVSFSGTNDGKKENTYAVIAAEALGSGTRAAPYIIEANNTYDMTVMGYQNLCGNFNLTCDAFDNEVITIKISIQQDGQYTATFSEVDSDRDLQIFIYEAEYPGSTTISYVGVLDDAGNGGTESITRDLLANDYYLFLISYGGADTIRVGINDGSGSSDGSYSSTDYDATGTWTFTTSNIWVDKGNTYGCEGDPASTQDINISQTGDSFVLTYQGKNYPGTVSGSTYSAYTTYPGDEEGNVDESIEVTLTSATFGSGKGEWYWSNTYGDYCSGGYDISVTKKNNTSQPDGGSNNSGGGGDGGGSGGCFITNLVGK